MSSIVSNETVWQDAVSNQQPAQEDYAYLAYLKLEVPSPEADHTVVSRFIAAYLVQRAGYSPCSALQHASKFGLDGQSLYDAELATFQRIVPMQGRGIWRLVHWSSPWGGVCTSAIGQSKTIKEKSSEPESLRARFHSESESCSGFASSYSTESSVSNSSLRARSYQRLSSTDPGRVYYGSRRSRT